MALRIRYKKNVNEDDEPTDNGQSQSGSNPQEEANKNKIQSLQTRLIDIQNKLRDAKKRYEDDTRPLEQQKLQIQKQINELGGILNMQNNESAKTRFGRRLYESVTNKTDEVFGLISLVFDEMDGLSYRPDKTRCRTFAKNIVAFVNKNDGDREGFETKFSDFLMNLLNKSQVSLSNKEKDNFAKGLIEKMKESTLFSWIFNEK